MRSLFLRSVLGLSLLLPLAAPAQVSLSITIAPPPLLVYAQPPVPGEGYIWMPGYWSWSDADRGYYWVPGTWVLAPNEGDLWTPGYWGFERASYFWHTGYWGSRVGYYGGINYGHGYSGSGYQGGRWDQGAFRYNRAISNVNAQVIHNAYSAPGAPARSVNHASFNGGKAGTAARPSAGERAFQTTEHPGPRPDQLEHETAARGMPTQRSAGQHGVPQVAATPRPSEFAAPNVEHARNQARPAAPRAPRGEQQQRPEQRPEQRGQGGQPEQRGQGGHAGQPQQEGPPRKER